MTGLLKVGLSNMQHMRKHWAPYKWLLLPTTHNRTESALSLGTGIGESPIGSRQRWSAQFVTSSATSVIGALCNGRPSLLLQWAPMVGSAIAASSVIVRITVRHRPEANTTHA